MENPFKRTAPAPASAIPTASAQSTASTQTMPETTNSTEKETYKHMQNDNTVKVEMLISLIEPTPIHLPISRGGGTDNQKYITLILRSGQTVDGVLRDSPIPGYILIDHDHEGEDYLTFIDTAEVAGMSGTFKLPLTTLTVPSQEKDDD